MKPDAVDVILAQWQRERPDLDVSPMGIIGRMGRLAKHIEREIQTQYAEFDLNIGEFDVLATLRRSGHPYQLSPTALLNSLMITSGTMTHRIDQLEKAGLVARIADSNDRRGTLVTLTEAGFNLIEQAVKVHVENEHCILNTLTKTEFETLTRLLRKLLASFEDG